MHSVRSSQVKGQSIIQTILSPSYLLSLCNSNDNFASTSSKNCITKEMMKENSSILQQQGVSKLASLELGSRKSHVPGHLRPQKGKAV